MNYRNKQKYYYCRHCGKKYLTMFDANLCFEIDMKNLTKNILKNENKNKS